MQWLWIVVPRYVITIIQSTPRSFECIVIMRYVVWRGHYALKVNPEVVVGYARVWLLITQTLIVGCSFTLRIGTILLSFIILGTVIIELGHAQACPCSWLFLVADNTSYATQLFLIRLQYPTYAWVQCSVAVDSYSQISLPGSHGIGGVMTYPCLSIHGLTRRSATPCQSTLPITLSHVVKICRSVSHNPI